jgi:S-disulfanyl-L-cysteine oxidoreductase SoxD
MSSFRKSLVTTAVAATAALAAGAVLAQSTAFPGIGRPATPKEVAAWDIDVRPDFKGLPKGSGSVSRGQDIWESKCSSCHGIFGEANEVFTPLVGGTTKKDVETGRVARLLDTGFPGRTTMMKVPTVSTLWDYIHRAMPWNAPKSLSHDDVYAVTAYLLNLAEVVPENFTLSDKNIAEVQQRMPNRNGMTLDHGMWPGAPGPLRIGNGGKPDIKAVACMSNCPTEAAPSSMLPDFARNQHGNLAEQNRLVGAQHGADTTQPAGSPVVAGARTVAAAPALDAAATAAINLLKQHGCVVCHGMDNKIVGPGFAEVAKKYAGRADGVAYMTQKIQAGGSGIWGPIPMPAQTLSAADAQAIAKWLADGAKK